ncbi:hypothetical protein [Psychromonas sp. Urea-02u-13]|uniref:hypothetical protein n=1 Tax=Psychromonas sp. Urea-02u-13 TaxID=2058326 RepID=UPI000C326CFC|nr:hypothetical protein [Psychromonas sp. Urea-02u-13]PKG38483.1 hypothetical protein CXF74_13380 [Psychromonas sp. Urea-02u-13]
MLKNSNVHQIDRVVIATIGLLSILSEGWLSDGLLMASMLLWLWLPEWEAKLLLLFKIYVNKKRNKSEKVN